MLNPKRTSVNLILNKNYKIIQYVESLESKNGNVAVKYISQKFEINISNLSLLLKNRENIRNLIQTLTFKEKSVHGEKK